MRSTLDLPADRAHVWTLRFDPEGPTGAAGAPELLARYQALLTPEEEAQRARFVFPAGRVEYLLTRALCRVVLSRYTDVAPADWRFRRGPHGKPEIDDARGAWLRFNLSNTRGLVACVVARGCDVGVDVEDTERAGETVGLANRFFSPAEVAALLALPPEARSRRFFEYWTLKEAYMKARGFGLSVPLDRYSFDVAAQEIGIAFDPRLTDDPADWQFALYSPTQRHQMAVALRGGARRPMSIEVRATVPLCDPLDGAIA
jgi:4'-phosphopantetheinyl transferase